MQGLSESYVSYAQLLCISFVLHALAAMCRRAPLLVQ
jgi:hypothetical protein